MNKKEFFELCHVAFINRGFNKNRKMYYKYQNNILCCLYFQKSYGEAYYISYHFYFDYSFNMFKLPDRFSSDLSKRFNILSRQTINGKRFMGSLIEYIDYTQEELIYYFDSIFDQHIMPVLIEGKKYILKDINYYQPLIAHINGYDEVGFLNKLRSN